MDNQLSLAARLDGKQPHAVRMDALAELARSGQMRVNSYFRRRGIRDLDILADLNGETWYVLTKLIGEGKYKDDGKEPMAYAYSVAHNLLLHHLSRDRRLSGELVPLDQTIEESYTASTAELDAIEEHIDQAMRYNLLRERLPSASDRNIVEAYWRSQHPPQVAEELNLNIKTVRAGLRRIAEEVRTLRDEDE